MKLIDKDDLLAEIERRQGMLDLDNPFGQGGMIELQGLKDKLDTLEVKEVDLNKEIELEYNPIEGLSFEDFTRIAEHFFELGISVSNKARKGE